MIDNLVVVGFIWWKVMLMSAYLQEIEHAASSVINLIWEERQKLELLMKEINKLTVTVERGYQTAMTLQLTDDDHDAYMMGVATYWDTYWGEENEALQDKKIVFQELQEKIAAQSFSIASLSGSLLQYAKQGISTVYKKPNICPNGRLIKSQSLKVIIWEGRNQALHFEVGEFRRAAEECFETLAKEVDTKFSDYNKRNMAFDIIELLGWKKIEDFKNDLMLLEKIVTKFT
ncbi:hypothetical protein VB713_06435 [Anabaena cylindrica UHCC 0172]|uniref:hypothetical protein n=1 Tax=Anabaena cylindrica TaxID=1165 RepID=UPI002B1F5147|nr:hypothetical protein [Anabaena cylindrica]MEA5550619.1 hypothetical protein [Anabaena cylindrica UHCC 0172]